MPLPARLRALPCLAALLVSACNLGFPPGGGTGDVGLRQPGAQRLCALDRGQLRVYDGHGDGTPLSSRGDPVDLAETAYGDPRGAAATLGFQGDQLLVASSPGGPSGCGSVDECIVAKAFPRHASGVLAPSRTVPGGVAFGLRAAWGELVYGCVTCVPSTLTAYAAPDGLGHIEAPAWQVTFGDGLLLLGTALDESRQQVVVALGRVPDPTAVPAQTLLRAYPRGKSDPAAALWELDLGDQPFTVGPIAVDAGNDQLVALTWSKVNGLTAPSDAPGDAPGVWLRRFSLSGRREVGTPRPTWLNAREVAVRGNSLRVLRDGTALVGASEGRLFAYGPDGRSWSLELATGSEVTWLASFAVDEEQGQLAVERVHPAAQGPSGLFTPARDSLALYAFKSGGLPELEQVIDGGASHLASPFALTARRDRGEVVVAAGSPLALTTLAVEGSAGPLATQAPPVGITGPWSQAVDGQGRLLLLAPREGAVAVGSADDAVLYWPEEPALQPLIVPAGARATLLADARRDQLWLVSLLNLPCSSACWQARVVAVRSGQLVELGTRRFSDPPVLLDPVKDTVWTAGRSAMTALPGGPQQQETQLVRVPFDGDLRSSALDAGRGELLLGLLSPDGKAQAVEIHSAKSGLLLRSLAGVHASALEVCQ